LTSFPKGKSNIRKTEWKGIIQKISLKPTAVIKSGEVLGANQKSEGGRQANAHSGID
jgi:hypothetical protein